jgi:3-oxo-5-alpha-steroid 4-dehydrogenase 1
MNEARFYEILLIGFAALAVLTFPVLFFITAPYGRHNSGTSFGPRIRSTVGWIFMESPSSIVFALCFLLGDRKADAASIVFLLLWEAHYFHRAFIFPFRLRTGSQRDMPVAVAAGAFCFTLTNGYLNGRYLFTFTPPHLTAGGWTSDPRFLAGVALFVAGYAINQWADHVLFNLRRPGETGYKIPRGGLYELISCPNYFGELIEWTGWALLTWSPAGLCFVIWSAANLVPRARSHHRWYKERFPDYPARRKAIIPFLF